ncbi:MAG: hypothetical protein P8Z30_10950 [Acidobacteriota bacterium]
MLVTLFVLPVLVAFPAAAQTQTTAQTPAASATTDPQETNIKAYIELLRGDVQQQKAEIMGSVMVLSAADAAKFWPIYSDYEAALNKLSDQRVANIREYARSYNDMTDEKADELIKNAMAYQKQRSELLEKTYERVKQALGGVTAARFVQVESQLLHIIDLQIASALPIVGSGS